MSDQATTPSSSPALGAEVERGAEAASELAEVRSRNVELSRRTEDLNRQNARLVDALRRSREAIDGLRASLERDGDFPLTHAVVVARHEAITDRTRAIPGASGAGVDILHAGRTVRTGISPLLESDLVVPGAEVLVNESLIVVAVLGQRETGAVMTVVDTLDADRLVVSMRTGERVVVRAAQALARRGVRPGELVLVDAKTDMALSTITVDSGTSGLQLAEVPQTTYQMIGGLDQQITQVRDAIELPFIHREKFEAYGLEAPRGVLLYGPPGTGKTMIAQAVAHALSEQTGSSAYFLNVKGPELLDKFVGETERHIRLIFDQAREQAAAGHPVVVFFDEMDALFRTRGTGVSSDVETTIVPQLLAEIDGVEKLSNVLVIGATNRADMLDPAVLRPGRLDVKVRIERPGRAATLDILSRYLNTDTPLAASELSRHTGAAAAAAHLREVVAHEVFEVETPLFECLDDDGGTHYIGRSQLISGAVIKAIVDRAKRTAIKRDIEGGEPGLDESVVRSAVQGEFAHSGHMPTQGSPDEWARILGLSTPAGTRIVSVRRIEHSEQ